MGFFLILNGNDQTFKNVTFLTDVTRRWNFHAIKMQTEGNESLSCSFLNFLSVRWRPPPQRELGNLLVVGCQAKTVKKLLIYISAF